MDDYVYVVNVDGVVVRDGDYLLIERAADKAHGAGTLAFPGGKVEQPPGTAVPIEATATRELYEEVGVEVGDVEYALSRTFEADDGTQCINVVAVWFEADDGTQCINVVAVWFEADDGTQCINVVAVCEYESGEAYPRAADEIAAVHWQTVDEIRARDVPAFLGRTSNRSKRTATPDERSPRTGHL